MRKHYGRLALFEFTVVLLLLLLVYIVCYPGFQKAKSAVYARNCMGNQQQIATMLTIYAVEHGEQYPKHWRDALNGDRTCLACKEKETPIGYGCNVNILGEDIKSLGTGVTKANGILLTADGGNARHVIETNDDIDKMSHPKGFVASFLDGHAEYLSSETVVKLR